MAQDLEIDIGATKSGDAPTEAPTDAPTDSPTEAPTEAPTYTPADAPTDAPTEAPTEAPTDADQRDCSVAKDERLCKIQERAEKRIQRGKARKEKKSKKRQA